MYVGTYDNPIQYFQVYICTDHDRITITGFSIKTTTGEVQGHAILLMCSVDLIARCNILNMKQFNGKFACTYCEDEGTGRATSHLHRNWLYQRCSVPRTHDTIILNAKKALRKGEAVRAVLI
jgi:hypothetical protein